MAEEQSSAKSFFTTLPGIITAIAGLITAIGGFLLVLRQTGCFNSNELTTKQATHTVDTTAKNEVNDSSGKGSDITYTPEIIKLTTRYLLYKIEKASIETLPSKETVLALKIKCINESDYEYHFYSKYIRVKIDEDKYAPEPYSRSGDYQSIPLQSFKVLEYNFKLPANTKSFHLVFYDENTEIGSSVFTLRL